MKVTGYIIVLAVAGLGLISCSKEAVRSEGGTAVAYIGLAADADGTKSSIDGLNVSWTAGDDIFYYTGRYTSGSSTALTDEGLYKVPEACDNLTLPVEYNDGDNRVTVLTKGRAVGTITPASLNSLTIADAVPASQDGTFASTYIAACEGNLLELTALTSGEPKNLTMTPVQAFVRFKLSSLTVGGQTVNRITVAGKSGGSAVPVCGGLSVSITENGSSTHTVSSAAGANTGNLITIDKSGSKFNAGEYIYVALLPRQYDELSLTLYNGGTILAIVPVKQGSGSEIDYIDLGQGKMVDLSVADAINDHAKIKFVSAKMYPEKVAITKDHTTKKLWLKIEPSDFNGTISWTSSNDTIATVASDGTLVDEPGIGKCIEVTVSNKCKELELEYTDKREVTISAQIHSSEDGSLIDTTTCVISIGEWVDLGLKTSDGKRCLWARQCVKYKDNKWSLMSHFQSSDDGSSSRPYEHFGWGENLPRNGMSTGTGNTLVCAWGNSSIGSNSEYDKYTKSNHYPYLQRKLGEFTVTDSKYDTVDDPCTLWGVANGYTTADDPVVHAPMILDCAELINNITVDDKKCTSTVAGYTDVFIYDIGYGFCSRDNAHGAWDVCGFWTAEYCIDSSVRAIVCRPNQKSITFSDRYRRGHFRPVMYTE